MSKRTPTNGRPTVADVVTAMETIAPTALAQQWDHVGLVAGDTTSAVGRLLLCIDLTPAVVDEAIRDKVDLVIAYHPPIFKPITSLTIPSAGTDAAVFRCIRHGIAIYTTHTALDAAEGGTNDVLASLIGIDSAEPLEYVDQPGRAEVKFVVFVPRKHLERVADAMFAAGAGHIGDYTRCSYRTGGQGTFFGSESTSPVVGERGRMEYVDEVRLESVAAAMDVPAVGSAIREAHPYEEPAFDIYPLSPKPVRGIGRYGKLPRPIKLGTLARKLVKAAKADGARIVGDADHQVERAVIVAGAAGSLPFRLPLSSRDVIITGEIRHHDALTIDRLGCSAIALGHWASERPVLAPLATRLGQSLPDVTLILSAADQDPLRSMGV